MTEINKRYIANSRGQDLARHSVLVGRLAAAMVKKLYAGKEEDQAAIDLMIRMVLIAGLLHDIGKLDEVFQKYMEHIMALGKQEEDVDHGEQIAENFGVSEKKKFTFENYPRHEEVSWVMILVLFNKTWFQKYCLGGDQVQTLNQNETRFSMVLYAVLWHHAKPARPSGQQEELFGDSNKISKLLDNNSDWFLQRSFDDLKNLLGQMDQLEPSGLIDCLQSINISETHQTPRFKALYEDEAKFKGENPIVELDKSLNMESRRTAIRSALVSADRIVSALSASELDGYIATNTLPVWNDEPTEIDVTYTQIAKIVQRFDQEYPGERTEIQNQAATKLAKVSKYNKIACLQGPAGCGKTKIALHYLLETTRLQKQSTLQHAKRVYVIVPRTAIGESLFEELVRDYEVNHRVELLTGSTRLFSEVDCNPRVTEELSQGQGNIVITTIDQICKTMLSHSTIDMISRLANSHVIFDEFHELFDIPGISLLFYEVMRLRSISLGSTLLVSATPMNYLLNRLGVAREQMVRVSTFNTKPLQLNAENWAPEVYGRGEKKVTHPFVNGSVIFPKNSFVICNTATIAQTASIVQCVEGRDVICFHSKFTPKEKTHILKKTLKTFGKNSLPSESILIAGPIVQASLNISTGNMHTEGCTAENLAQRIGRNNRFAFLPVSYVTVYWAAKGNGLSNGVELGEMYQRARVESYHTFLKSKLGSAQKAEINLDEFYRWNDEYQSSPETEKAYEADFLAILLASVKVFRRNDFDPTYVPNFEKKNVRGENKSGRLAKNTLRSSTLFVLPLKMDIFDVTKPARLSLLWNSSSSQSELMTDDLRSTEYDGSLGNKFHDWTTNAYKPSVISHVHVNDKELKFLGEISHRMKKYRKWDRMRYQAYDRNKPIVVSTSKYDDDCLYYLNLKGVNIGLIKASSIIKNIHFSKFDLTTFV